MPLLLLIIGAVFVVAAIRDTQGTLFHELGIDTPAFVVWFTALFIIGAIGFVPGLKPVSRGLMALVLIVLVLTNYKQIIAGFQNAWQPKAQSASSGSGSGSGKAGGVWVTSPVSQNGASTSAGASGLLASLNGFGDVANAFGGAA